ncbi:hypothetical protein Syun_022007 [Stephania yunnanensis]|uniref:Uncharacterized protein n=1 Tax=Stephania yunnanensis TaxID=152371 RepID=A0AAP0NRM3_9MAGN
MGYLLAEFELGNTAHSLRILQVETGKLILLGLAGSEQIEKTGKQLCDNSLFAMTVMLPLITSIFKMNMVTSILPMVQLLSPTSMASLHGYIFRYRASDSPAGKSTYSLIREPGEVVKIKYTDVPLLYYTEILSMPETELFLLYSVSNQKRNHFSVSDRISDDVFRDGIDFVSVPFLIAIRDEFLQIRDGKFRF